MRELQELTSIITKNKLKNLNIFDFKDKDSLYNQLYEIIYRNETTDENEIIEQLYGEVDGNKHKFSKLKNRLKEKLQNTLFLTGHEGDDTMYSSEVLDLHKQIHLGRVLYHLGFRQTSFEIVTDSYNQAVKLKENRLIINTAPRLLSHHSLFTGDVKTFESIKAKYIEAKELMEGLDLALIYYYDIVIHFTKSKKASSELLTNIREYIEELKKYRLDKMSGGFKNIFIALHNFEYQLTKDYQGAYDFLINIYKDLIKQGEKDKNVLLTIRNELLEICIYLKKWEGAEWATMNLEISSIKRKTWHNTLMFKFLLSMHCKKTEEAIDVFSLYKEKGQKQSDTNTQELWKIFEAYLFYILYKEHGDDFKEIAPNISNFKVGRFLNEVPIFSKDKEGMNISLIVIQVLYYLIKKDFDKIYNREEAIRTYIHRYTKSEELERSNIFLKMLLTLPRARFQRDAVEKKAAKNLAKLKETHLNLSHSAAFIEVIPYEVLWDYILETLIQKRFV